MFVPPYRALVNRFRENGSAGDGGEQVTIPVSLFNLLLQFAIAASDFDDEGYTRANPDVAGAVQSGSLPSAYDHYVGYGYFEGRRGAFVFDEAWYRGAYPDVDAAINAGQIGSAAQHFFEAGAAEGRSPNAEETGTAAQWKRAMTKT